MEEWKNKQRQNGTMEEFFCLPLGLKKGFEEGIVLWNEEVMITDVISLWVDYK